MSKITREEIRATLADRPAGILERIHFEGEDRFCRADYTFAALFNGAINPAHYVPAAGMGTFFAGKAEAERGWPLAWEALRDAGLIEYREEEVAAPGAVGGKMIDVHWSVTALGWQVREDDLAFYKEMVSVPWEPQP
jgi:hypothetical protein